MKLNHIYQGDTLQTLKTFPDNCVNTIITSPPYWGLRDYGEETKVIWDGHKNCEHIFGEEIIKHDALRFRGKNAAVGNNKNQNIYSNNKVKTGFCPKCGAWYGQLGLEPTLDLYLRHLLQITAELKRVLKPTGVMFWNHGDSYGGSGKGKNSKTPGKNLPYEECHPIKVGNTPDKCLALQNYRVIIKMIDEQGWILRNDIKWVKPNHMPSSVKDRFANGYEPVFMLVKKKKYWFDLDAVRKPHKLVSLERLQRGASDHHKYSASAPGQTLHSGINQPRLNKKSKYFGNKEVGGQVRENHDIHTCYNPKGKNPGDVWTIPTQPFPESHFATFPEKLIIPMIKSACPEWICKKCGKARERITKKGELINPDNMQNINKDERNLYERGWNREAGFSPNCYRESKTIGWTDCSCGESWNQGVVLDPFMGSGTVAKVAMCLHRNYIGIEISSEYIKKISNKRLAQQYLDL